VLSHLRFLAASLRRVEQTDGDLLRRFVDHNDQQAFAVLVKRHGQHVFGVCRRVLIQLQDAEDAFQATFLLLARRAPSLLTSASVGGWLHEVAHRMAMTTRRATARRRRHEAQAATSQPDAATTEAARRELQHLLDEAVSSLPSKYREPFVLCCLEELGCSEAARRLRIKEGTVWSRLAEARKRLRRSLTRRGVAPGLAAGVAALGADSARARLPADLIARTARAAALWTSGQALPAGAISSQTLALVHRTGRTTMIARSVSSTFLLLGVGLLGGGLAFAPPPCDGQPASAPPAQTAPASAPTGQAVDNPAAGPKEEGPQGWLTGQVLGPDGDPVVGARVWAARPDEEAFRAGRTDSAGRFRIGPIPALGRSRRDVFVEAPTLARAYLAQPTVFPDGEHDLGTIRLQPGKRYRGQVLHEDGSPAADVQVKAELCRHQMGHTLANTGGPYELRTGPDGRFELPPLPVGILSVTVTHPECQTTTLSRTVLPGPDEALDVVRLRKDVPFTGLVRDPGGKPIAGAEVTATAGIQAVSTGADGRFTLRGMGKERPTGVAGRVSKRGYSTEPLPLNREDPVITLRPAAYIFGQAVDAETGQPVRLGRVICCYCERGPAGEVLVRGCSDRGFQALDAGRFRIAYATPGEYHLTASADGYDDGEAFTPRVSELKPVEGIVIRMTPKRNLPRERAVRRGFTGHVTRAGRPVARGIVSLMEVSEALNAPNAYVLRGRTTVGPGIICQQAALRADGSYALEVPGLGKSWYVAAEVPGEPPTVVGPVAVGLNELKRVDVACTTAGSLSGRVKSTPAGLEGYLCVVAFTRAGFRAEAPVVRGRFTLPALPPGEYGLKVGHDAFVDAETQVPLADVRRELTEAEKVALIKAWNAPAEPWKRAKVVRVEAGKETAGIELELPEK
jgi:RNA polymerase sigma factor (sigma-70 family)